MNELSERRKKRTADSYGSVFEKLAPLLPTLVSQGDEVAAYFDLFVKQGITLGGAELRRWCHFDWKIGTFAVDSFTVTCKVKDHRGTFFSVERLYKPEITNPLDDFTVISRRIDTRLETRDTWLECTFHVLGWIIPHLIRQLPNAVSYKEDNGIHLLIKEGVSPDLYLKIYLGGCFTDPIKE